MIAEKRVAMEGALIWRIYNVDTGKELMSGRIEP